MSGRLQNPAQLASLAAERQVTFHIEPMTNLIVYADRPLLSRVVDNVLPSSTTGPAGQWTSPHAEEPDGDSWTSPFTVIGVRDTGQGIPEGDRERVFERFYRTDRSRWRRSGGAGIGLAIVSEVVRLFGGTIRIAQSSPSGTTLEIRLPGGHVPPTPARTRA